MRTLIIFYLFFLLTLCATGQPDNTVYDSVLAKKLGADAYGMKSYVLVMLKTGSNKIENKAFNDSLFAGHLQNINRLAKLGKLTVAGPIGKNDKQYRGIFILNVTTFEEANELLQSDPTISAKVLEAEMYKWYGSAALPVYLETHKKIEKNKIR